MTSDTMTNLLTINNSYYVVQITFFIKIIIMKSKTQFFVSPTMFCIAEIIINYLNTFIKKRTFEANEGKK